MKTYNHLIEGFTEEEEYNMGCSHEEFLKYLNNPIDDIYTHQVPRSADIISTCERKSGICDYRAFKLVNIAL